MSKRGNTKKVEVVKTTLVNPFGHQHGQYVVEPRTVTAGEFEGEGHGQVRVLFNRGGTAVERWLASGGPLFEEPQRAAIKHCQRLWARLDHKASVLASHGIPTTGDDEYDGEHEALTELVGYKQRLPRPYWDVYERVCRWDEEAGVAGSRLATNKRSAIDTAKTTVAFVASMIALWRGL